MAVLAAAGIMPAVTPPPVAGAAAKARYVRVGDRRVKVPTESGLPISPTTGTGSQVVITRTGFEPRYLSAAPHKPITWTNLTDRTQWVTFEYSPVHSGPIPPGGTFTWTPAGAIAVRYGSRQGFHGNLLVGLL